jgi:hypothetical protein
VYGQFKIFAGFIVDNKNRVLERGWRFFAMLTFGAPTALGPTIVAR